MFVWKCIEGQIVEMEGRSFLRGEVFLWSWEEVNRWEEGDHVAKSKVEASIVDQVHLTIHYDICDVDMDEIYIFLGKQS